MYVIVLAVEDPYGIMALLFKTSVTNGWVHDEDSY